MSWLVSAKQYIPTLIGEAWGGGYFAGYISHTANGSPTHALIVAPKATGVSSKAIKTANTSTTNSASEFDGRANTDAAIAAGIASHPAAEFCVNLDIGGYTDWYLPAKAELEIAYYNLKPTTTGNDIASGTNIYAVPSRSFNYTSSIPAQTTVTDFNTTAQSFTTALHATSTQDASGTQGFLQAFNTGQQLSGSKTISRTVRAFRRIAL